ncbi:MAG: hypothetical protein P4L35_15470 [Ignavibacteriaceae bacterium]|nr:hypothetical protein [Ignavibacteriaceae bacterium]
MKNFVLLYNSLNDTIRPDFKVNALVNFFKNVPPGDSAWALGLLLGKKNKKIVSVKYLMEWSLELAQIPAWLFNECRVNVNNLVETISLILPVNKNSENIPLQALIENHLIPLFDQEKQVQKEKIISIWHMLNPSERYICNKLVTGSFHIDLLPKLIIKALSRFCGISEPVISYRLSGNWVPTVDFFNWLCSPPVLNAPCYNAFPFKSAVNLNQKIEELGEINEWLAEWNWKGIRSRIIKKGNMALIWSHDNDLLNDTFPELFEPGFRLPDGIVLDGIIIPMKNNVLLPPFELQKRIVKRYPLKKIISDIPVSFVAFDLLEFNNAEILTQPLINRRTALIKLLNDINEPGFILSPLIECSSWNELKKAKDNGNKISFDGIILKRIQSTYESEIPDISQPNSLDILQSSWFQWKNDPHFILAVLLYARLEQGSANPLFKEYTFALWDHGILVPFAKTSIGLTEEEVIRVDNFIRNNTLEKFGPVRTVIPELVFEIEFEGVQKSVRHKSGIIVHSPRIIRWHFDKKIEEIGSLEDLTGSQKNQT